jgi:uncharacterized protein YbjT (DUF2867 family)
MGCVGMNVIVFGATGMIGGGVLIECLDEPRIETVLTIGRRASGRDHPKLKQMVRSDLSDFADIRDELRGYDACFYCLGVSAAGMSEEAYRRVTLDLTLAAADVLADLNPELTFCYVSGQGTDSSEQGRIMWARVKGATENRLLSMSIPAYMFRPGLVQPMKGVRSSTRSYRVLYGLTAPFMPLLRRLLPTYVTTTEDLGRAMVRVSMEGCENHILDPGDINELAGR